MQVKRLESKLFGLYNEFLNVHPQAMLYYALPFSSLLEDFLQCSCETLVAIHNGKIEGILPLMSKTGKYGKILNSLPFYGSNGGALVNNKEAELLLLESYEKFSSEFSSATFITNPLCEMLAPRLFDFYDYRIGQWTALGTESELLDSFESSAIRNIKKARREGVQISRTNDISFLYETHFENMQRIGGIHKEKEFFEKISSHFVYKKEWVIYEAFLDGNPIAALLLFYFGETIEYYVPAICFEYRTLQALPLIIWTAMCDGKLAGYKMWNWGGTWRSQDNVYKFKKKFGAQDKKYHYYIKINNPQILHCSKEELLREYPYFYVIPFEQLG